MINNCVNKSITTIYRHVITINGLREPHKITLNPLMLLIECEYPIKSPLNPFKTINVFTMA